MGSSIDMARARDVLPSCLEAMEVGLEIWDDQDRLVLFNQKDNYLRGDMFLADDIGKTYGALTHVRNRRRANRRQIGRLTHQEPALQQLPGDQWVKNFETLTPEGYLLVVRVNVTEIVRHGRLLEAKNRQLALLSTTDSMTGLANRRRLDELVVSECQRATRNATPLSLLMVDIDHFKKYNDQYGHLAGDECLRRVAGVLRQCTRRAGELAARYGGEEFVILLPSADAKRAREIAEKCMRLMKEQAITHAVSPTSNLLTVSIGIATLSGKCVHDATALVRAADAALYRAKAGGRARYELATPQDWAPDAL